VHPPCRYPCFCHSRPKIKNRPTQATRSPPDSSLFQKKKEKEKKKRGKNASRIKGIILYTSIPDPSLASWHRSTVQQVLPCPFQNPPSPLNPGFSQERKNPSSSSSSASASSLLLAVTPHPAIPTTSINHTAVRRHFRVARRAPAPPLRLIVGRRRRPLTLLASRRIRPTPSHSLPPCPSGFANRVTAGRVGVRIRGLFVVERLQGGGGYGCGIGV
jgi:hypothetical protein